MTGVSPRSRQLPLPRAKMDQFSLDGDEKGGGKGSIKMPLALLQVRRRSVHSNQFNSCPKGGCKIVSRQNDGGGAPSSGLHFKVNRVGEKLTVKVA